MTPLRWEQLFPWRPWDIAEGEYDVIEPLFEMADAIHTAVCELAFEIQWAIEEEK